MLSAFQLGLKHRHPRQSLMDLALSLEMWTAHPVTMVIIPDVTDGGRYSSHVTKVSMNHCEGLSQITNNPVAKIESPVLNIPMALGGEQVHMAQRTYLLCTMVNET